MEKKEYLNEDWYQNVKKKVTRISLIILIVGIVIGTGFIVTGIVKQNNAKNTNEQRYQNAYKEAEKKVEVAVARLNEIKTEKETLNVKISEKDYECDSMDIKAQGWFANNSKCSNEAMALKTQLAHLEMEEFKLKNLDTTVYYTKILPAKYVIFYIIGAVVIGLSLIVSLIVYIVAKRREIRAFGIQQTMPVTQEVIDKMAPTIGNAAGTIVKDITSGIKEGLNDKE